MLTYLNTLKALVEESGKNIELLSAITKHSTEIQGDDISKEDIKET